MSDSESCHSDFDGDGLLSLLWSVHHLHETSGSEVGLRLEVLEKELDDHLPGCQVLDEALALCILRGLAAEYGDLDAQTDVSRRLNSFNAELVEFND